MLYEVCVHLKGERFGSSVPCCFTLAENISATSAIRIAEEERRKHSTDTEYLGYTIHPMTDSDEEPRR